MERREFLIGSMFVPGAVSASSRDWLIGPSFDQLALGGGGSRVSMDNVREVRALGDGFERLSHQFGAKLIRWHMVNFLQHDVAPLLRGSRTEAVGRALFQTAAEFTASAGYMAVDCNELGLAGRYYTLALRLADAGGSRDYGAQVMATHLGHLSLYAGYPGEAVQLAQAAREGGRQKGTPLAAAVSWAVEARGHARMGDAPACARALSEAERHFHRSAATDNAASYLSYFKEAYLADTFAHCFRDLQLPVKAKEHARAALGMLPVTHIRRRSINTAILADASLSQGEPDAAAQHALEAVRLTRKLHSPRGFQRIARLRKRFAPHTTVPGVAEFTREADVLLANASLR
ncbi:transcriptional regulator [Streptomyces sp. 8N706]|uniref:transcriptional regulator n=1 Tax=Streptomyces sp. 8N706 TaxID=3457416 RepID=UPI003FD60112